MLCPTFAPPLYLKSCAERESMTGQGTADRSSEIWDMRGSSQPTVASQWASRKVRVGARASAAPSNLKKSR